MLISLPQNRLLRFALLGGIVALPYCLWVTLVYSRDYQAAVTQNGATLPEVLTGYLFGGLLGGCLVGIVLPLYQSAVGAYFLGVIALLPLYLGISWIQDPHESWLPRLAVAGLVSGIVGGPVAVGSWLQDHDRHHAPEWVNALRYPSWTTVGLFWILAVSLAGLAWWIGTTWPGGWQAGLAIVVFLVPVASAAGITLVALRQR